MILIYILVTLSFLIGAYSVYKDGKWKASVLQELKDIHICAFSANYSQRELLKLAQSAYSKHFISDYVDEELQEKEKVSDR